MTTCNRVIHSPIDVFDLDVKCHSANPRCAAVDSLDTHTHTDSAHLGVGK